MREIVWDRVALLLDGPSTLLDIGCGTGIDAQHFADLGHRVLATDYSQAMVERAGARQITEQVVAPQRAIAAAAIASSMNGGERRSRHRSRGPSGRA